MRIVLASCLLVFLIGCSDTPKLAETAKEPEKPAEPVTGRQAFQQMYPAARTWGSDCLVIQLLSIRLSELKAEPGKAGAWQATFESPRLSKSRTYTYSVIEAEGGLHKGVFPGSEESYSGPRGQSFPFLPAALKIDSDKAYETAVKQSTAYLKKNPDKPVLFILEQNKKHPDAAWRVVWGESVSTSDYSVYVDASSGSVLEKTH